MSKPKAILLFENKSHLIAFNIAQHAISFGLIPIVVIPTDTLAPSAENQPFLVIRQKEWSYTALSSLTQRLQETYQLTGINSVLGLISPDGPSGASVAKIAQANGLAHNDPQAILLADNKYLMRRRLAERGVYTVRHALASDPQSLDLAIAEVQFPLIIKPLIGCGSTLISRCQNREEALQALQNYQQVVSTAYYKKHIQPHDYIDEHGQKHHFDPLKTVLVEEAIDGHELSVECLCTENEIYPLLIHDKLDVEQDTYCVYENLLVTPPVQVDLAAQEKIKQYAVAAIRALGIKNQFCHFELRYDSQGRPSVLEINPRIGGMRVKNSLATVANLSYEETFLRLALGLPVTIPPPKIFTGFYGMMAIYPRKSGTIRRIHGLESASRLPGMLDIKAHFRAGETVGGDYEEVFVVDAWFHGRDLPAIHQIDQQIRALVKIEME